VVDDDRDILNMIAFHLSRAGPRVVAAESGPEALRQVGQRGAPDVAVLDVTMPGMPGFELLRRLREDHGLKEMPAIFLSARVTPQDIEAGRALGARYLTKPFVATALLGAIKAVEKPPEDGW
jgi:CheY-like chemotaxis protein